jgi:hypothetical protein
MTTDTPSVNAGLTPMELEHRRRAVEKVAHLRQATDHTPTAPTVQPANPTPDPTPAVPVLPPFGSGAPDPLAGFDSAAAPAAHDPLAAFDKATGRTTCPAGWYICAIEKGELTTAKSTGKPTYRLTFRTVTPTESGDQTALPALPALPGEYSGFRADRYYSLADAAGFERAKAALAPLGLLTAADLRSPFPPFGKVPFVKAMLIVSDDPKFGSKNDVQRFVVCGSPAGFSTPVNPFAVPLFPTPDINKEGGAAQ